MNDLYRAQEIVLRCPHTTGWDQGVPGACAFCIRTYAAEVERREQERLKPLVNQLSRWVRFVCRSLPRLSDDCERTVQDGLNYSSQLKQAIRRRVQGGTDA